MYHTKMLAMWANRYIAIAKERGNGAARAWAAELIPIEAKPEVKKIVEQLLNIQRG